MPTPLDNPYELSNQQNQQAFNGLVNLATPEDTFIWTGRPYSLWVDLKKRIEHTFIIFLYYTILLVCVFLRGGTMPAVIAGISVLFFIFSITAVLEYRRRRTFYGITAKEVWVKKTNTPLRRYPIPMLTQLTAQETSLSYSTIKGSVYEKTFLFENIDRPEELHTIITQLQQENK